MSDFYNTEKIRANTQQKQTLQCRLQIKHLFVIIQQRFRNSYSNMPAHQAKHRAHPCMRFLLTFADHCQANSVDLECSTSPLRAIPGPRCGTAAGLDLVRRAKDGVLARLSHTKLSSLGDLGWPKNRGSLCITTQCKNVI